MSETLTRAMVTKLGSWQDVQALDDATLEERLYGRELGVTVARAKPDCCWIHTELRRAGVTLQRCSSFTSSTWRGSRGVIGTRSFASTTGGGCLGSHSRTISFVSTIGTSRNDIDASQSAAGKATAGSVADRVATPRGGGGKVLENSVWKGP